MHDQDRVRESVKQAYSQIAENPTEASLFPAGRALAEGVGYPPELLDALPAASVNAFCGLSDVSLFAELSAGMSVLDVGCGAGLDTLIAARRIGEKGKVFAVDFSETMLERARVATLTAHISNVEFLRADAENLPIEDASMDAALVNGIFNLNPHRDQIFSELARVLKPHGTLFAAEIVLAGPLPEEVTKSADS